MTVAARLSKEVATSLGAAALRDRLASGASRPAEVAEGFLEAIARKDGQIHAFSAVEPELVRMQAAAAERRKGLGRPAGSLNGVPVALKDIVDTADLPTENGTALDAGRRPRRDATIVARLKAAGAVILGKTHTTELAYLSPGPTRNPHDTARTPGGSSSGSAAAVAAGMAPVAIGTQTNGSIIRPASFCGVVGYKPSFGLIPRTGILRGSRTLDTVGVFGRSVEDVALVADALVGFDGVDPDVAPMAGLDLLATALSHPPAKPDIGFVRTPFWDRADAATQQGLGDLVALLGPRCVEVGLAESFGAAVDVLRQIMTVEMAVNLDPYARRGEDKLSQALASAIAEGRRTTAFDYLKALEARAALREAVQDAFHRFDVLLAPAAIGEAPVGDQTGDPVFASIWSLCGLPAVTLPLLEGENGLPVGVQLIGAWGSDARLLRTARWLGESVMKGAGG